MLKELCLLSLVLTSMAQTGCCLVVDSVPEVGSTIAGFENETNILVQCKVVDGSAQRVTIWSILKENDGDGLADLINNLNPDYSIIGDPVPGEAITFRTNLTILSLTADFDRAVLFCGTSEIRDTANFTLRISLRPSPPFGVTLDSNGIGSTSIRIQWFPPVNEGMPPFSTYNIYVDPPTGTDYSRPRFIEGNVTANTFTITGLQPGVLYEFTMTAVFNDGDFVAESNRSNVFEATTDTTVPLPECSMAPSSENGVITVSWDYVHTGGLNLTSVQVLYRLSTEEDYLGWLEGDVNCTSDCFLVVYNLTAGFSYVFVINASNDKGPGVEMCPEVSHTIGIPTNPVILFATSNTPGEVTLNIQVSEAGVGPAPHSLVFDFQALQGSSVIEFGEVPQGSYVDGTTTVLSIEDQRLEPGQVYSFRVRARNTFGESEYAFSDFVTVKVPPSETSDHSSSSSSSGVVVGGSVAALVVVATIVTISIIVGVLLWKRKPWISDKKQELESAYEQIELTTSPTTDSRGAQDFGQIIYDEVCEPNPVDPASLVLPTELNAAYGVTPTDSHAMQIYDDVIQPNPVNPASLQLPTEPNAAYGVRPTDSQAMPRETGASISQDYEVPDY